MDILADASKRSSQVLPLAIGDKNALYAAYMPFIRDGGLFIHTNKSFKLDDEVFVLLRLLDEPEKIMLQGKVVWITPHGAENKRPAGIGLQFIGENAKEIRTKIDTYLAEHSNFVQSSDTL